MKDTTKRQNKEETYQRNIKSNTTDNIMTKNEELLKDN